MNSWRTEHKTETESMRVKELKFVMKLLMIQIIIIIKKISKGIDYKE